MERTLNYFDPKRNRGLTSYFAAFYSPSMPCLQRQFDSLYQTALDAINAAERKAYLRGMCEGIAVGLALSLMVWALSRS